MNKRKYTKLALLISVVAIIVWGIMGTGTSLAWFTDTDEDLKNIFHFSDFDLDVEYRDENGFYHDLEGATAVFDANARYEPGYVQVVHLRVKNNGEVPFNFKTAVSVNNYTEATNLFGQKFLLQEHLRFGLVTANTEQEMDALVATRALAKAYATLPLNNYSTDVAELAAGQTVYMALVVQMPEEVDNIANYRGDVIPRVELGIIVTATQLEMPADQP